MLKRTLFYRARKVKTVLLFYHDGIVFNTLLTCRVASVRRPGVFLVGEWFGESGRNLKLFGRGFRDDSSYFVFLRM